MDQASIMEFDKKNPKHQTFSEALDVIAEKTPEFIKWYYYYIKLHIHDPINNIIIKKSEELEKDLEKNINRASFNTIFTSKADDQNAANVNAKGNIYIPNPNELATTIPLNLKGSEFIREKIKEIKGIENIKKNAPESSITTIIEQTNDSSESYEIYTLNQISKGLIRT